MSKQLKDLTTQELNELMANNKDIYKYAYNLAYDEAMQMQEQDAEMLGTRVFDFHDHYNSFYYTTPIVYGCKTPEKVAHKLNDDYMNAEAIKLYDKLNSLIDDWESMTTDEQENSTKYDEAIETCDKLAEELTKQLRAYEDIDADFVLSELEFHTHEGHMADWVLNDDGTVTETIEKVYK